MMFDNDYDIDKFFVHRKIYQQWVKQSFDISYRTRITSTFNRSPIFSFGTSSIIINSQKCASVTLGVVLICLIN